MFPPARCRISPAPSLPAPGPSCTPSAERDIGSENHESTLIKLLTSSHWRCVLPRSAGCWRVGLSGNQESDPRPAELSPSPAAHSPSGTPSERGTHTHTHTHHRERESKMLCVRLQKHTLTRTHISQLASDRYKTVGVSSGGAVLERGGFHLCLLCHYQIHFV